MKKISLLLLILGCSEGIKAMDDTNMMNIDPTSVTDNDPNADNINNHNGDALLRETSFPRVEQGGKTDLTTSENQGNPVLETTQPTTYSYAPVNHDLSMPTMTHEKAVEIEALYKNIPETPVNPPSIIERLSRWLNRLSGKLKRLNSPELKIAKTAFDSSSDNDQVTDLKVKLAHLRQGNDSLLSEGLTLRLQAQNAVIDTVLDALLSKNSETLTLTEVESRIKNNSYIQELQKAQNAYLDKLTIPTDSESRTSWIEKIGLDIGLDIDADVQKVLEKLVEKSKINFKQLKKALILKKLESKINAFAEKEITPEIQQNLLTTALHDVRTGNFEDSDLKSIEAQLKKLNQDLKKTDLSKNQIKELNTRKKLLILVHDALQIIKLEALIKAGDNTTQQNPLLLKSADAYVEIFLKNGYSFDDLTKKFAAKQSPSADLTTDSSSTFNAIILRAVVKVYSIKSLLDSIKTAISANKSIYQPTSSMIDIAYEIIKASIAQGITLKELREANTNNLKTLDEQSSRFRTKTPQDYSHTGLLYIRAMKEALNKTVFNKNIQSAETELADYTSAMETPIDKNNAQALRTKAKAQSDYEAETVKIMRNCFKTITSVEIAPELLNEYLEFISKTITTNPELDLKKQLALFNNLQDAAERTTDISDTTKKQIADFARKQRYLDTYAHQYRKNHEETIEGDQIYLLPPRIKDLVDAFRKAAVDSPERAAYKTQLEAIMEQEKTTVTTYKDGTTNLETLAEAFYHLVDISDVLTGNNASSKLTMLSDLYLSIDAMDNGKGFQNIRKQEMLRLTKNQIGLTLHRFSIPELIDKASSHQSDDVSSQLIKKEAVRILKEKYETTEKEIEFLQSKLASKTITQEVYDTASRNLFDDLQLFDKPALKLITDYKPSY